jgi:hypothetical protein
VVRRQSCGKQATSCRRSGWFPARGRRLPGTYVDTDVTFVHTASHIWNHGLGEIVTALLDTGMVLTQLAEHDSVPWNALPGQMSQLADGEWRVTDRPARLPHTYTLQARKL